MTSETYRLTDKENVDFLKALLIEKNTVESLGQLKKIERQELEEERRELELEREKNRTYTKDYANLQKANHVLREVCQFFNVKKLAVLNKSDETFYMEVLRVFAAVCMGKHGITKEFLMQEYKLKHIIFTGIERSNVDYENIVEVPALFGIGRMTRVAIEKDVCEKYNLGIGDIASKKRHLHLIKARQELFTLLYEKANLSAAAIGRIYGFDHSTILHHLKKGVDNA